MTTQLSKKEKNLFLVVSFILWFSHFVYVPILTPYMEIMGSQYLFIGIVLSSYGLMQFVFRLPIGLYSDLIRLRKPFIVLGMVVSAISCFVFALTDQLIWLLVARSLAGIAVATWVVFTVLYSSYFADKEVHRAMSSISFVVVLAQLIGMTVSGYIVELWGWHAPFWIGGVFSIAGAFLSLYLVEAKESELRTPVKIQELIKVLKEPLLLKVSILSILAHSIIFTTMFGFIPAYVVAIGLQASDISAIVFSFMIPHAVATLFIGKYLAPKFGKWRSLQMAFLATACFTILTPLIESIELLMFVQGLNGFSLGLLFPLLLGMAIESIPHEKRATAMGVYQALYAIGMFTGPFLAGILNAQFGIAAGFYLAGILGLVASILVMYWNKQEEFALKKIYQKTS